MILLLNISLLARVVHGEIYDVSVLSEGRAKTVFSEPRAIYIHSVTFSHSSPLGVWIWPYKCHEYRKINVSTNISITASKDENKKMLFLLYTFYTISMTTEILILTSERPISVPVPISVSIPLSASVSVSLSVPIPVPVSVPVSLPVPVPVSVSVSASVPVSVSLSVQVSVTFSFTVQFTAGWHASSIVLISVAITWTHKAVGAIKGHDISLCNSLFDWSYSMDITFHTKIFCALFLQTKRKKNTFIFITATEFF